jgi:signal transduction histidine kinase
MVAILVSAPLFAESVIDGYSSLSFSRLSQYFVCSRQSGGLADGSTSNFDPRHWAVRVGLLAALTIPHIKYLALENVVTDNKASAFDLGHFFLCSFYFRGVATVGSLLVFVSSREMEVIGSGWMCIMASLTYVAGQILRLNAVGHRENRTALHMSIASTCLLFIAFAQLIFIGLIWVLKSVLRPYLECRSFSNVKGDQFTTLTYIGAILLMAIGSFAIEITEVGIQGSLLDASPDCLEALIYLQVAFTVIIVLTPQYAARRDLDDARAALEGKKTFLQYISHEIRTPLNTVTMGLTCMREDVEELTDKIRPDQLDAQQAVRTMGDTLGDVESSCQAALTILNELLMSDKMESGKLQLEAEHCPPWAIFLETIRPFYVQARQKNIALTLDCVGRNMNGDVIAGSRVQSDLDKFLVYVDKNKIAQVVRNLLSNALKFTPEGRSVKVLMKRIPPPSSDDPASALYGGAVAVPVRIMPEDLQAPSSRTLQAEENSFLRVEVVDNGAGISAKNQKNLFKKYAQFDAAKLQKGGGTGLGLWISRGIVELHGGRIGAYSEGEGKGCSFFIELPITSKVAIAAADAAAAAEAAGGPSRNRLERFSSDSRRFVALKNIAKVVTSAKHSFAVVNSGGNSRRNSQFVRITPPPLKDHPWQTPEPDNMSFRNCAHHVFDAASMAVPGSVIGSGAQTPRRPFGMLRSPEMSNRLASGTFCR